MKCANCGAEIKVGCIYCSVCGKEAQIVSDYNLLEDDFLRNVLKEKEEKAAEKTSRELLEKEKKESKEEKASNICGNSHNTTGYPDCIHGSNYKLWPGAFL